ncbi:MAG: protein translocase subunit SecD [Firmicutes bacterium]|nr:protein translocase subunit SecD [Bacillota bacterium]
MGRRNSRLYLALLILVVIAAGIYLTVGNPIYNKIPLGLDLRGGVHAVLEAEDTPQQPVTEEAMQKAVDIIRYRVDKLGVAEPIIQRQGSRRIIVELAGIDPQKAIDVIGRTALLEFVDDAGNVIVTGANLKKADAEIYNGKNLVTLELDEAGTKQFADATARLVGKPIHILLDKQVVQSPTVSEPIPNGKAQITGYATYEDARNISIILNSGALPVTLKMVENRSVSGTLGTDSIHRSLVAGVLGLAAVVLFMLGIYRVPGLVADFALGAYVLIVLGAMVAVHATLSLPGLAGIILSIGMAVDANVIIFERIKEEIRLGKGIRSAMEAGFKNAYRAILDSNVTTLIAAVVLFYLGTGPIRGFAVTLSIGILASMFTAITLTRIILVLMADVKLLTLASFVRRAPGGETR